MKRRSLLKGLGFAGGATLLAPLASRLVRASESNPKFVFVVEGNCVEPRAFLADSARAALAPTVDTTDRRWWYRDYSHDAPILVDSADMASAASCAPLAEMASEATAVFGLSCKISGGGHTASHGPLSSARTIGSSPGGITIDAYLAANAPCLAERPFPAVRLGVGADPLNPDTCALDAGRAVPLLQRPATAYQVLFGAAATGAAGEAFQRRGSMLDFVADDIAQARDTFTGVRSNAKSWSATSKRSGRSKFGKSNCSRIAIGSLRWHPKVQKPIRSLRQRVTSNNWRCSSILRPPRCKAS